MKIKFIQHASIIIDCGKNKILCDPWFTGTAFNDGWKSIHDSEVNINDLDFNYIWFSHEHPDHFSVPDLKKLKRKDIKILYQETIDNKVRDYCTNAGFEVIELKPFEKTKLDYDLVIVNGTDGLLWPARFIGFGIGIVVYALMVSWLFGEGFTTKTIVSIAISLVLISIQVLWK